MRRLACVLLLGLLGLSACDISGQDVDAGLCIDCDWRPLDADVSLAIYPARPGGQQGCMTGWKVAWIQVQESPERLGKTACVPSGPIGEGGSCTFGPTGETTGFDNCAAGFVCSAGICADICAFEAAPGNIAACATGTCTADPLLFANGQDDPVAGVCR